MIISDISGSSDSQETRSFAKNFFEFSDEICKLSALL